MDNNPRVSVVMPVYNGEKTVEKAVKSILAQTYANIELIIANDQSTDKTASILNSIAGKYLRVVNTTGEKGVSAARKLGVSQASGRFVAMLDADDFSYPRRIETQVAYMLSHNLGLCGTWAYLVKPEGTRQELLHPVDDALIKRIIIKSNTFIQSTIMFDRQIYHEVGGYNSSILFAEDYDLWLRIVKKFKAGNVPKILGEYTAPPDTFGYLWREQTATARVRLNAIRKYGYSWRDLPFVFTPLLSFFIPKRLKILLKNNLLRRNR